VGHFAPAVAAAVSLSAGFRTDVGRKRTTNEDSVLAEAPVFIVADGMGGHEAGDLASDAVVTQFRPLIGSHDVTAEDVATAVEKTHAAVRLIADGTTRGAGSTLTGVVLVSQNGRPCWLVINIGDSRVYRLVGTSLAQLTVDHSLAQEMVAAGTLKPEDVARFPRRNVITRAVGAPDSPADYWLYPVTTGERLLVCSDGLSGELSDEAIRAGLTLGGGTQQTADLLLAQALERGGRDNVSLIVIDVVGGGESASGGASTASLLSTDDGTVDVRLGDTQEVPGRRGRPRAH
jgi:protein phosphatase